MNKKFLDSRTIDDWEVLTPTGWVDIKTIHQTVPMKQYTIKTESYQLTCADQHILFDDTHQEIFAEGLSIGDKILTIKGLQQVTDITIDKEEISMYDLQVNSFDQQYYTSGILSHNTATAALYLLWYAMFNESKNILIAAHVGAGAAEIMDRVRFAYESCPDHIRCGTTTYSASKMVFDNNSRIEAATTTENTGRGKSISLLYCLDGNTKVTVKDKNTGLIKTISLEGLYTELDDDILVDMEETGNYKIKLENDHILTIPEGVSVYSDDKKVDVADLMYGDTLTVGTHEIKIKDIMYESKSNHCE